jgi:predicted DNA-binding transcriptional regulator AlpA
VSAADRAATLLRRGLRRPEAATYIGVSPSKFDNLIKEGVMPKSFNMKGCVMWDIRDLDDAFDALKNNGDGRAITDQPNPLDAKWLP